ncbi:hypothetical protein NKG94_31180 [Micromonospora sp. M12]
MGPLVSALFDGDDPLADPRERGRLHYVLEQRHRLLDELEALLKQAVRSSPILMCLDDMQWADSGSLVALQTLPSRLANVPIVWLAAFRAGQTPPVPRAAMEALRRSGADSLLLAPLEAQATREIVTDVVRARPDQALLALAQRAHGSPFLLMEMLRGLEEERLLRIEAGCASLIEAKLPRRVRDSMRDRLSRMSEMAGRLASVAAVLGRTSRSNNSRRSWTCPRWRCSLRSTSCYVPSCSSNSTAPWASGTISCGRRCRQPCRHPRTEPCNGRRSTRCSPHRFLRWRLRRPSRPAP